MIFRLLILFLIIWFLIWLIKKQLTDKPGSENPEKDSDGEDMIPCDYCGTHVPKSLVIHADHKNYCSEEHATLDD